MSVAAADLLLRIVAATVMLGVALTLFRQRREVGIAGLLVLPLAICLSGFLAGNTSDPALRASGGVALLAGSLSGATVIFLWWFCLAIFDRTFRPDGAVLATGLIWLLIGQADRVPAITTPALSVTLVLLGIGIVGHLVWRIARERDDDMVLPRRDARVGVASILGGLLLVDLLVDLALGFAWRPRWFAMAQNGLILAFAVWLGARTLAVRPSALRFSGQGATVGPTPTEGPLEARIRRLIAVERVHLNAELDFAGFVRRMAAPERVVRRLVNQQLGFDHFRAFLNHHRVAEACRLLDDPARSKDKLVAIALDSGFASLASFNRAFRAEMDCSPSAYRDRRPTSDARSALF